MAAVRKNENYGKNEDFTKSQGYTKKNEDFTGSSSEPMQMQVQQQLQAMKKDIVAIKEELARVTKKSRE